MKRFSCSSGMASPMLKQGRHFYESYIGLIQRLLDEQPGWHG